VRERKNNKFFIAIAETYYDVKKKNLVRVQIDPVVITRVYKINYFNVFRSASTDFCT
jgi:hypothetical protein